MTSTLHAVLLDRLKRKGNRLTAARTATLEILVNAAGPLSPTAILEQLHRRSLRVNKTTVYRELDFLERNSMIRSVLLSNQERTYELADLEHHHHVVCNQCSTVKDVNVESIEEVIAKLERVIGKTTKFSNVRHSLEFFGQCQNCNS